LLPEHLKSDHLNICRLAAYAANRFWNAQYGRLKDSAKMGRYGGVYVCYIAAYPQE
jgi:hypothetical protein